MVPLRPAFSLPLNLWHITCIEVKQDIYTEDNAILILMLLWASYARKLLGLSVSETFGLSFSHDVFCQEAFYC